MGNYASSTQATGYTTEQQAVAGALASAAAIKEVNPNAKVTVAVGPTEAIQKMTTLSIGNKGDDK